METLRVLVAAAVGLIVSGTARADFVLTGTAHRDVTASHTTGVLMDSSTANIKQNASVQSLSANDMSRLWVEPGALVATLDAYNKSTVDMSGGEVDAFSMYHSSAANISRGTFDYLYANDHATVDKSDGHIGTTLFAHDYTTVNVSGGYTRSLYADGASTVDISGGQIENSLYAYDDSTLNMSGGGAYYLHANGFGTVGISGGDIYYLSARGTSIVDISGGQIEKLGAFGSGIVRFYGQDFQATDGLSLDGETVVGKGLLSGKWFDETPWATTILDNNRRIQLIHEPPPPPVFPGDANRNGFVDDTDLAILLANWEQDPRTITTWELGNFTQALGDFDVDDDDLSILLSNWTGAPPAGAIIPEPATLSLVAFGGLAVMRRRRR